MLYSIIKMLLLTLISMHKSLKRSIDVDYYINQRLKNKKFKELFDEYGKQLEIAYQILQLRKKAKLSQSVFAKRIGTSQSNVARMEQGNQNFTIGMLTKVAKALHRELEVTLR